MENERHFRDELMSTGIVFYSSQGQLLDVARHCLRLGVPLGGSMALGAAAGSVAVPGVGAVPGWAAGFLGGLLTGTATCTALDYSAREQLKELLD